MKQDDPAEAQRSPGYHPVDRAGQPAASGRYARLPYVRGERRRARSPLARQRWSNLPRPDEGRSSGAVRRGPAAQIQRCHDRRPPVRGRGLGFCLLVHARRSSPGAIRQPVTPPPGHGRRLLGSFAFSPTPTRQIGAQRGRTRPTPAPRGHAACQVRRPAQPSPRLPDRRTRGRFFRATLRQLADGIRCAVQPARRRAGLDRCDVSEAVRRCRRRRVRPFRHRGGTARRGRSGSGALDRRPSIGSFDPPVRYGGAATALLARHHPRRAVLCHWHE